MQAPVALTAFVQRVMQSFACGAHDYAHVERVCKLATLIARQEGADERVAYVGALVHDVLDSKLVLDAGESRSIEEELVHLLRQGSEGEEEDSSSSSSSSSSSYLSEQQVQEVLVIVKSVGFKNLLRKDFDPSALSIEYRCVQDADLLDAIGAVGVARCFAFGGKRARPLFGLPILDADANARVTAEEYAVSSSAAGTGSGVEHFFEKLLIIKDMMTTATGRRLALKRHTNMLSWLQNLDEELEEGNCEEDFADQKRESELAKRIKTVSKS